MSKIIKKGEQMAKNIMRLKLEKHQVFIARGMNVKHKLMDFQGQYISALVH